MKSRYESHRRLISNLLLSNHSGRCKYPNYPRHHTGLTCTSAVHRMLLGNNVACLLPNSCTIGLRSRTCTQSPSVDLSASMSFRFRLQSMLVLPLEQLLEQLLELRLELRLEQDRFPPSYHFSPYQHLSHHNRNRLHNPQCPLPHAAGSKTTP